jgi:hypothetical protein
VPAGGVVPSPDGSAPVLVAAGRVATAAPGAGAEGERRLDLGPVVERYEELFAELRANRWRRTVLRQLGRARAVVIGSAGAAGPAGPPEERCPVPRDRAAQEAGGTAVGSLVREAAAPVRKP